MQNNENKNLINRPPVVVILGHVDAGKTSLLLAIRNLQFTGAKPGGVITQHIGAYQVGVGNPPSPKAADGRRKITFIDTPGHEAFSAMRARGAKVADVAILVVDGVSGVQPQTKEAISHIKDAKIPFIVAINKTDNPQANPEKIKQVLMKEDVLVESLGGKIPSVNVSAKTGQGINELLELIQLVGEITNLKGDISKPAEGVVIESYLDPQRGPVATVIVSDGTLKIGDILGTFSTFGKVKNLENFLRSPIEQALPSDPVVIIGLPETPKVGEIFKVFSDTEQAKSYLKTQEKKEIWNPEIKEGQKVLNLILKSDVVGSIEAIYEVLKEIPQEKVILNIIKSEAGEINESDVKLARSTRAAIFGFRTKANPVAKQMAERDKIKILTFDVIYDLVEGVRKSMERILSPESVRLDLGKVKVLALFLDEKNRQIVGGRVVFGEVKKGAQIEVLRNDEAVGKGRIISLQKNKRDAERVAKGEECGILYEGDIKIETGDLLGIYTEEKQKGEL
ncbi:MAG: translation initiation factor IF-2 [Candidatus Pacebacteria bacterium]|nr:translation initiation factor IF-2 [Candidatus Paceibacterota bacterium]